MATGVFLRELYPLEVGLKRHQALHSASWWPSQGAVSIRSRIETGNMRSNAQRGDQLRELYPLEVGLKRGQHMVCQRKPLAQGAVSIRSRIETLCYTDSERQQQTAQGAVSIRSRIETHLYGGSGCHYFATLRELYPLEVGLKLTILISNSAQHRAQGAVSIRNRIETHPVVCWSRRSG